VFHYIGAGSAFVPKELSLANSGFDLTLAAYLAYEAWSGARALAQNAHAPARRDRRREK
jgi:hypothetical protein